MVSPGEQLLRLCAQAKEEVVLVAPFVKSTALERVLEAIPDEIETIKCVARWWPEEIAAGACDLEIFDLIKQRPGAQLLICPWLHAKFFRVDARCLVGSANLTQRALGWAVPANLELLLEESADTSVLKHFESTVFSRAFEASEMFKLEMASAANDLLSEGLTITLLSEESIPDDAVAGPPTSEWLPLCPVPSQLYEIYTGEGTDRRVAWTTRAGDADLQSLRVPRGLSRKAFNSFIASSIQQIPFVQRVYEAAQNPIAPQDGEELVASYTIQLHPNYSPRDHWNILIDWLLYFLPQDYRQPRGSNDLQRGREIGEW